MKFALFNKIVNLESSYVCRLRDNSVWKTVTTNYRNDNAGLDEIISDEIADFNGDGDRKLNHKQNGIEIQTYSAIIACMLFEFSFTHG